MQTQAFPLFRNVVKMHCVVLFMTKIDVHVNYKTLQIIVLNVNVN